jgi:hypothetical protein
MKKTKKTTKKTAKPANVAPSYDRGIELLGKVRYNLWMGGSETVDIDLYNAYHLLGALYGKTPDVVMEEVEKKTHDIHAEYRTRRVNA